MATYRQWLEELHPPEGILRNTQKQGRETLSKTGLPTKNLEPWRLTDLKRLEKLLHLPIFKVSKKTSNIDHQTWANKPSNGLRIVLDPTNEQTLTTELYPGIHQLSSEELRKHLDHDYQAVSQDNQWPLAINHATTNQILALRVRGQNLPVIELILPAQKNSLTPTRVLILLEDATKLQLLQVALGSGHSAHSHLTEIHLGKQAKLDHGFIALGGGEASCLANLFIQQDTHSNYSLTTIQHGWSLSRLEPQIIQLHGRSQTEIKGLQISTEEQQLATHSLVNFQGPDGTLKQLQKAIACKKSHSIFNGIIQVPQIAQKTNASQLSRNLLLSNRARIDTKPELEIIADDVRCAHGATVSQLQEDELFYLRSRGINSNQATYLLLQGYCKEIIDSLPSPANEWGILNAILSSVG